MFCSACGARAGEDDDFCRSCGQPLTRQAASEPARIGASDTAHPGHEALQPYPSAGREQDGGRWAPPTANGPSAPETTWNPPGAGPYAAFGAPLAGWWQRVGAMLLDALIMFVPFFLIGISFGATHTGTTSTGRLSGSATALIYLVSFVVEGIYFSAFNGLGTGQTPGNRAPGIAVRDAASGAPIGFWRSVLRWLVRTLLYACLIVPGIVNDLFPLWNRRRQTLADMAARSVIVKLK